MLQLKNTKAHYMRKIVFLVFFMGSLFAAKAQQIYLAGNGLTATPATGTTRTVSLGGTVTASTVLDYTTSSTANFIVKKATANYFFVGNTGNIGIGTATPLNKLSIAGATATNFGLQFPGLTNATTSAVNAGKALSLDASGNVVWVNVSSNFANGITGTLPVINGGTGLTALGSAAQQLRVNTLGTALEYFTPASGGSGWNLNGNTVGAIKTFGTADNFDLPIITNSIERMRITSAGNILLNGPVSHSGGTFGFGNGLLFDTYPVFSAARIYSGGTIVYQSNSNGNQHYFANQIGAAFGGNLVTVDPGNYPALADQQLSLKVLGKNGAIGLNVNMLGNTGIGTISPAEKLDVIGKVRASNGFYLNGGIGSLYEAGANLTRLTGGYSEFIDLGGPSGNIITLGAHEIYLNGTSYHTLGLATNKITPYSFYAAGSSLIGTSINSNWVNNGAGGPNYGSTLGVGDININTATGITNELNTVLLNPVVNTSGGTTKLRGLYYKPTLTSTIGVTNIAIETVTGNTLLGTTSGNTLIGPVTDDGVSKLQVAGNIKTTGLIIPTGAAAGMVLTSTDANGNASWQPAAGGSGGSSNWTLSGNNIVNTNTTGVVVIGGTLPTNAASDNLKLAVGGSIYAQKLKITASTNWADYVFDPSYKLRSLTEVAQFIQQNQHLPEVPSAAEVAKNGVDIGDNQVVLLKKVEELTLYMIELNKKVDEQNALIKAQAQKIQQLSGKPKTRKK